MSPTATRSADEGLRGLGIMTAVRGISGTTIMDEWGPGHVLHVYDPDTGMQGTLIIDNTRLGPACGCIRMSHDIGLTELFQLARTMTWSCALADTGFGGAAAWIRGDPDTHRMNETIEPFAKKVAPFVPEHFIAFPSQDVGMEEMGRFASIVGDHIGASGKPVSMGGIPHESGIVGLGFGVIIEEVVNACHMALPRIGRLSGMKIIIQRLDLNTVATARYLMEAGATIIAAGDGDKAVHDPRGLDREYLEMCVSQDGKRATIRKRVGARVIGPDELIAIKADMLIANDGGGTISESDVEDLDVSCIIEGCLNAITPFADRKLEQAGVLIIPDTLTMACCAISAYAEYQMKGFEKGFSMIDTRMRELTSQVVERAFVHGQSLRGAAVSIAQERIQREQRK